MLETMSPTWRGTRCSVDVVRIADPPLDLPGARSVTARFATRTSPTRPREGVEIVSPPLPPGAAARRLAEYVAGRYCAEHAIAELLGERAPVAHGPDRAPVWPPGVIGSIAHAGGIATAAVTTSARGAGIGVDVESLVADPWLESTYARITTPSERGGFAALGLDLPRLTTFVLSAKESVYKCLQPLTGAWLGFRDVALSPSRSHCRAFGVTVPPAVADGLRRDGVVLHGSYVFADDVVYTAVWAGRLAGKRARRRRQAAPMMSDGR
jgi:enterobactin synthetase component D